MAHHPRSKPGRIAFLLAGCILLLQGCTQNFVVKPSFGAGRTELRFYQSSFLSDRPFTPCLDELILFEHTNPLTVAWQIRPEGPACVPAQAVELGRAPPGFREITRFSGLPAGTEVHVSARAGGGQWGGSDSWRMR